MLSNAKLLQWVGHRGWPQNYPENSLSGLRAALDCGAQGVEIDVQLTADGEPVVIHDINVQRVAQSDIRIDRETWSNLASVSVHEPLRFGDTFAPTAIPHLRDVVSLVAQYPHSKLFVEIKSEAFEYRPRKQVLSILMAQLKPIIQQVFLISYDLYVLRLAQELYPWPVGWVLTDFDRISLARLAQKPVDILICNICKVPEGLAELWPGPWQWFIYDIVGDRDRQRCVDLKVTWCETWDIGLMLQGEHNLESI